MSVQKNKWPLVILVSVLCLANARRISASVGIGQIVVERPPLLGSGLLYVGADATTDGTTGVTVTKTGGFAAYRNNAVVVGDICWIIKGSNVTPGYYRIVSCPSNNDIVLAGSPGLNGSNIAMLIIRNQSYYIYQPTAAGDWFRWEIESSANVTQHLDTGICMLNGVTRGKVYAGKSELALVSYFRSGYSNSAAVYNPTVLGSAVAVELCTSSSWVKHDAPIGATHFRIWPYYGLTGTRIVTVRFYNSTGSQVGDDVDVLVSNKTIRAVSPSAWVPLPTSDTVAYCKVWQKQDTCRYIGVDWIDVNTQVSPDTPGAMMYDGPANDYASGDVRYICKRWLQSSYEMAVWWNTAPRYYATGTFPPGQTETGDGAYSLGGMSHRHVTMQTDGTFVSNMMIQTGTTGPIDFADESEEGIPGQKTVCDWAKYSFSRGQALYNTINKGDLSGYLLFDCTGCRINHTVSNLVENMYIYVWYSAMCPVWAFSDAHVWFDGEITERFCPPTLGTTTYYVSNVKTSRMRVRSPSFHVVIELEDNAQDAMRGIVPDKSLVRYSYSAVGDIGKMYIMRMANTADSDYYAIASGGSFKNDFKIRISDDRAYFSNAGPPGDIDDDGNVDFRDFATLASHWLEGSY